MSDSTVVSEDPVVASDNETFTCVDCGEEKPPAEFKKNRYGLTTQCKECFGAAYKETRARNVLTRRKAAELAEEVARLGGMGDADDDLEGGIHSDHATEVLSELLATVGRACLNAAKRLSR